jgi:hypothetical protein
MSKKKINYQEGSVFAVPLQNEFQVTGLVARFSGDGRILGYFFADKSSQVCPMNVIRSKGPKDAIMVCLCGDLSILKDNWPILGRPPEWCRVDWPMPKFIRTDAITSEKLLVHYNEDTLDEEFTEPAGEQIGVSSYPEDGLWGARAVEIALDKILRGLGIEQQREC